MDLDIKIFTDGSCLDNGKVSARGGYGVVVVDNKDNLMNIYSERKNNTTNNEMELMAILTALKCCEIMTDIKFDTCAGDKLIGSFILSPSVKIYSDSAYCVNTINTWMYMWERNNWTRGKEQPIKNLDIIKEIYNIMTTTHINIEIIKVSGHNGIKGNELADKLATGQITTIEEAEKFWEDN